MLEVSLYMLKHILREIQLTGIRFWEYKPLIAFPPPQRGLSGNGEEVVSAVGGAECGGSGSG
jgi:hypothetical protein